MPCEPWISGVDVPLCPSCKPDVYEFDEQALDEAATVASAWLYRLSGRLYPGTCSATVRPQMMGCGCGRQSWYAGTAYGAPLVDSFTAATNTFWCGCRSGRRGENVEEITLGYFPVTEILEIRVDGIPQSLANYRLDDNRWLVSKLGIWPLQNLHADAGDPGTWTVTFRYGVDPPLDGVLAARALACEYARWVADLPCKIPTRATNLARQGVNIALLDPAGLLENGRFGIPEVDGFLQTVNPSKLRSRPQIINVDLPRPVRPATSSPGS